MRDQAPAPPPARLTEEPRPAGETRAPQADGGPARHTEQAEAPAASVTAGAAPAAHAPAEGDLGERSREEPAHPGVSLSPPGVVPESDVRVHSPAAAQPHHNVAPWVEDLGELPPGYGDGRLVSLLRDPRTIFVYWDLSPAQLEQAFHGLGPGRALLKLWTAPQGGEFLREVEVNLEVRGWYVRELPPGIDLRVELWVAGERGARLIRAARPLRLPPAEASTVWDEIYVGIPLGRRLGRGEPLSGGQPLQWRAAPAEKPTEPPAPQRFLGSSERFGISSDRFPSSSPARKDGK